MVLGCIVSFTFRIYKNYIKIDDHPSYPSTYDRQKLQSVPTFKYLIYDIIERKNLIKLPLRYCFNYDDCWLCFLSKYIPRMLYAMVALEYRVWQLLPDLLDGIEANLQVFKHSIFFSCIFLEHKQRLNVYFTTKPVYTKERKKLAILLVGKTGYQVVVMRDWSARNKFQEYFVLTRFFGCVHAYLGDNRFGPTDNLSKNYNDIVYKLIAELKARPLEKDVATAFDWAGMSYAMVLLGMYEWLELFVLDTECNPTADESPLPMFLRRACEMKAIPIEIQELLHTRWLNDIVLNGQKQGTELLQMESDALLTQLRVNDALINCSVGRQWDEQHCWFVGHLIRSRNLAIEYDYLLPIGPGRPKVSGTLQCRQRLLKNFGYNSATLHKCFWNNLDEEEKYLQISQLLSSFRKTREEDTHSNFKFEEKTSARRLKHRKEKFDTWPPDKIVV
ncbi:hypothetical protein IE077_001831 [Cardiosporidium cionae]|uniref:DUF6832 domain-containing protein n=1 Tax=Cardiosporidium cionae TaxID=476202 RepID=A0ABQ7JGW4_9APIC|nr:hypothetical protein IE077_001831 [Cardiosporidium cionae]|eukprot:KAF8822955.1 hypothetical protein IE077_001831 [Cardiosporidium cionae]